MVEITRKQRDRSKALSGDTEKKQKEQIKEI